MICLLGFVLLFGNLVWAQPVEGPWRVTGTYKRISIDDVRVMARNDSVADLVFVYYNEIYHAGVNVHNGLPAGPSGEFVSLGTGTPQIVGRTATPAGTWAVAVYTTTTETNTTLVYRGRDNVFAAVALVDEGQNEMNGPFGYASRNSNFTMLPGNADTISLCWLDEWSNNFEGGASSVLCLLSPSDFVFGPVEFAYPSANWNWLSQQGDSGFVFASSDWYSCQNEIHSNMHSLCRTDRYVETVTTPLYWERFGSREYVILENESADSVIVSELSWTEFTASERFRSFGSLDAVASNRQQGLAWLVLHGYGIELFRVDTLGNEVSSAGLVAESGAWRILDADLSISDGGTVYVVWTEQLVSDPNDRQIKLAAVNWTTPLTAEEPHLAPQPSSLSLTAFPNPFNSELQIKFDLPRAGDVELATYNVLGQRVETILNERFAAGDHVSNWSPRGAAGLYFIQLRTAQETKIVKALHVK